MDIVFLGLMFTENSLKQAYKLSKYGVQIAPHNFQKNLFQGFAEDNFSVVNVLPVGSFLVNYRALIIKEEKWGKNNIQLGYVNLPKIKHLIQQRKLTKILKKKLREKEEVAVIVYSLYKPYLKVVEKLKKKYENLKVFLLQTDAVWGVDDRKELMTPAKVKLGKELVERAKCCDGFILLSEQLKTPLEIGDRPYVIVECVGGINVATKDKNQISKNKCLYTGGVEKEYGVLDLARAFKNIPDAELWICGAGDAEQEIKELSNTCENIKYYGFVKHEEVEKLQNQCDFLINPRRPSGTYTKYSFPSKTVEYMLTAKPVIMYKLEALPDEYDEYLNYLTADTPETIAEQLKEIFVSDYEFLKIKGEKARTFVLENKNAKVQAKKIIELIEKTYEKGL